MITKTRIEISQTETDQVTGMTELADFKRTSTYIFKDIKKNINKIR